MTMTTNPRRPAFFPKRVVRSLLLSAAIATTILFSGCADRTYLTKSHGRAYAEAFDRQAVPTDPKRKHHTDGLDSQEAAAVARAYRNSLGGKEGGNEGGTQPMVIMNPGNAQSGGYMPPPSVPGGQ
jgi:hypothetical protein